MKKIEKGEYGYLKSYKNKQLIKISISLAFILITLIIGICIYKTTANVITVIPAVLSLPFAKFLVGYIIVMKYHTCDILIKNEIESCVGKFENVAVLYDLAIASEQAIMYVPVLIIYEGNIYALFENMTSKVNSDMVYEALKKCMLHSGNTYEIKLYKNVDELKKAFDRVENTNSVDEETIADIKKQILIYCV